MPANCKSPRRSLRALSNSTLRQYHDHRKTSDVAFDSEVVVRSLTAKLCVFSFQLASGQIIRLR